jgi:acyl-CoA synthetase (NDP forming)
MIWEAFFRQTGVIQVNSLDEGMDAVLAFALLPPPSRRGVFLIGAGGGTSVVNSDTCIDEGLDVPPPSSATMDELRKTVPIAGSIAGNPLDDWQTFINPDYLGSVLDLVCRDPAIGMVVVERLIPRRAYHMGAIPNFIASAIEQVRLRGNRKPVVFVADSGGGNPELAAEGADLLAEFGRGGIPAYPSVRRAARALVHLYQYYDRLGRMKKAG